MADVTYLQMVLMADLLRQHGLPTDRLYEGMPWTEADLRAKRPRWVSWEDYLAVLDAYIDTCGGLDEADRITADIDAASPGVDWMLAGLVSPVQVVRFWCRVLPKLVKPLRNEFLELPDGRIRLTIGNDPSRAPGRRYYAASRGSIATMTRRIGLPASDVVLETLEDHRAVYLITPPPSQTIPARIRRLAVDYDLMEAIAEPAPDPEARARDAVRARAAAVGSGLDRLRAAGQRIAASADAAALASALDGLLAAEAGLVGVRVRSAGDVTAPLEVAVGTLDGAVHGIDLHVRGRPVGRLEVATRDDAPVPEALSTLAPWLSLAWDAVTWQMAPRAVDPALLARGGALFVVDGEGRVAWANGAGRDWIAATRDAEVRIARAADDPVLAVRPLPDLPGHALVSVRDAARDLADRLDAAMAAWSLTPAQAQVLALLVRGMSNKEIAGELGNAESTVEVHVTQLFRKSGVAGRTALTSRFWADRR